MNSIDLLNKINNYSKNKIVNIDDLKFIIDITSEEEFNKIIFTAKFLKGMLNILMGNMASKDEKMKLMPEYTKNISELTENLKSVASKQPTEKYYTLKYFQDKYFDLNQLAMQNLTTLITDLAYCKEYFNDLREK